MSYLDRISYKRRTEPSCAINGKNMALSDDEIDHDLLKFMKEHMNGNGHKNGFDSSTGVLESAERIYNVSYC